MQLYKTESKTKYKVLFDSSDAMSLGEIFKNISIRNIELCAYIEERLPKVFDECKRKRVMVLNIVDQRPSTIMVMVLVQDIKASFPKPHEKRHYFKVTELSFYNIDTLNEWISKKNYTYKIIENSHQQVKVIIFNMSQKDEMELFEANVKINTVCNIAKYFILQTAIKLEKCLEL